MSVDLTFSLPDVGEGLTEAEIVNWRVAVGDTVQVNDVLVEIETAKSVVELPSPHSGIIDELLVQSGETVSVGTILVRFNTHSGSAPPTTTESNAAELDTQSTANPPAPPARPSVLVGYGPSQAPPRRRKLHNAGSLSAPHTPPEAAHTNDIAARKTPARPPTKPPLRRLARQLGVDLESITPGSDGVITRNQIESAGAAHSSDGEQAEEHSSGLEATHPADTRIPIKGVRKAMASAMVASAFSAPHASLWLSVDMTETMGLVRRLRSEPAWQHVKVGPLLILAKATLLAARRHPTLNSSWDETNQQIVIKHAVNLGVAAATPRGLLVPNIKGADRIGLLKLAEAITDLVTTAKTGKTTPEDMDAGTLTITNVGVFGVEGATPILNPGEAAILAFGAVRKIPWVVDDSLAVREVAQLSLSIDHRLVDGEQAGRFLSDIAAILSQPADALLYA